ncbi:efflux RND transporter periplasmic adaptor subunit [Geobacter sp. DSM 9736]|uniref:efflux RND transporter periplasmic adaptor subunit n=1 Tax=Geobacter sp. DSM 9736 TaxID=1277350 RepID=UPI000B511F27|nr:efflux RND transporter periplasmic adaptor subunit [Geobacter sp. DSM 9736]SNB45911.1 HlyD family secretion protein [Geobacter sp. DSM 9736]
MKRHILIPAILLLLAAVAAVWHFTRSEPKEPPGIKVSGTIEVTDVAVSFKIPGRVEERLVDEGEAVTAGQLIARLDDQDQNHEVAARQGEVNAVRAALAELEAGSRSEEIAQAEAAFQRAKAESERFKVDYERDKALFAREVIPARQLDASRTAFETSRAAAREAAERLSLVRKGPRQETISQARARLQSAEAALAEAKTRLGYTELRSPLTGVVLAKHTEPGELVAAGTPLVTVGNLHDVWLRAYITETDLGRVKLGQKARVTSDSWPGKAFDGTITFISSEAEFTPKNVQTEKERVKLVYRIKISVGNPQQELKPGMPADALILADNR